MSVSEYVIIIIIVYFLELCNNFVLSHKSNNKLLCFPIRVTG